MAKKDSPAASTSGGQGAGNPAAESLVPGNTNENAPGPAATSNQSLGTGSTGDGTLLAGADDTNLGETNTDVALAVPAPSWMAERVPAISVTAHRDGYRRAGRAWSKQETVVQFEAFDDEQIRQLRRDPNLTVHGVYIGAEMDGDQQ